METGPPGPRGQSLTAPAAQMPVSVVVGPGQDPALIQLHRMGEVIVLVTVS